MTSDEIDGAEEARDIDNRRASSGVVEVIESPGIPRYRELFDMSVAVQSYYWQFFQISAEDMTDARNPRPIDETEIVLRVSS